MLKLVENTQQKEIIYSGNTALLKLNELGLNFVDIENAVQEALKERNKLSVFAYSLEKYNVFFYSLIRNFRQIMFKKGWEFDDSYNLNKTFPANKDNIFIFSSGDNNVCNKNQTPMTRNKKGEVSLAAVEVNNCIQLTINFPNFEIMQDKYNLNEKPHWFFLFYRKNNRVKIELSLAAGINNRSHKINFWKERIILPEIEILNEIDNINKNSDISKPCYNKEDELNITRKN